MLPGPPPSIRSRSDRTRAAQPGAPLGRISIEIARRCNLRCVCCYTSASPEHTGGLGDAELRAIVDQAAEIGARLVSVVGGGEPLLRESLLRDGESLIDHAGSLGCYCHLYTNGTLVQNAEAQWLSSRDVSVVGKLNSLHEDVQDGLVGVKGSSARMRRGIDALLGAGLTDTEPSRLALETIVCPANYDELPDLWRWMRTRRIIPEVEIPTMHGRALEAQETLFFREDEAPTKYEALFEELARIDREQFGFAWQPHPPFPAGGCSLFETNCYVNDHGGVQPCAGVDRDYGSLRTQTLREIVTSTPFAQLRNVRALVKPPCRGCDLLDICYGCRGAAYQATGDVFAGDPVCWRRGRTRTCGHAG
jgi:radical SAM protein with 4Fe4S-binding SPASM domain